MQAYKNIICLVVILLTITRSSGSHNQKNEVRLYPFEYMETAYSDGYKSLLFMGKYGEDFDSALDSLMASSWQLTVEREKLVFKKDTLYNVKTIDGSTLIELTFYLDSVDSRHLLYETMDVIGTNGYYYTIHYRECGTE